MRRLAKFAVLVTGCLLSACQFFGPGTAEQTLVAQNQALSTEIAAVRATATVEADRRLITQEYALTEISRVNSQTGDLQATLVANGTSVADINLAAITPQAPVTLATPPPVLDLGPAAGQVTPISITPGGSAQTLAGSLTTNVPPGGAGGPAPVEPEQPTGGPSLSNIVTADAVGADDCALQASTTFTTSTPEIYVVAVARGVTAQDVITSTWSLNNELVVEYDWSPSFEIEDACIWFFIDQAEVTFTPGTWTVQLSLNGTPVGLPATFTIQGASEQGDAMLEDALGEGTTQ